MLLILLLELPRILIMTFALSRSAVKKRCIARMN